MSTLKERKAKYSKQKPVDGVKFNFDLTMMNTFCSFCLSENTNIHHNSLVNLRTLFNRIDESIFESMQECIVRYRFCKRVLDTKLDKKISRRDYVLRDVYGIVGSSFDSLDPNNFQELANEDAHWVEQIIGSCMDALFINNKVLDLQNTCTEYMTISHNNKMAMVTKLKEKVGEIQTQFRRHDVDQDGGVDIFRLSNPTQAVIDIHNKKSRPSYKLMTGMQGFNDMIAGGFTGGRVYCLFGLSGEGKTTTILNLLYQLKKYNRDYVCKDKTKRPCLVLLTMEDKTHDLICTLFNIACSTEDISNYSPEEALQLMMARELAVTMDSPIDIVIKYKPINSVDTNYLYKLTEDLEDEGYEVIAMLQDYIKRIKPVDGNDRDERFRLGNVINDFRNFAIYKDIPVITASQLNREAARIIDDSRNTNKNDLVKKLGRANIGESSLIDENLDATIFITPEWINEQKYLGIKLTKHRYRIFTKTTSIYQPFELGNDVKLMEDEGLTKPLYRETLLRDEEEFKKTFGDTIRFSGHKEIRDIEELELEEGKVLTSGTVYEEQKQLTFTTLETGFTKVVSRIPMIDGKLQVVSRVKPVGVAI